MRSRPIECCVCGHGREAHEHYRAGTECAVCAEGGCARFRPEGDRSLWSRVRRVLRGRR